MFVGFVQIVVHTRAYKKQKYVHKQSKMESQRNAAYIKNIKKTHKKKNAIDINITQMMVGKQWVKR